MNGAPSNMNDLSRAHELIAAALMGAITEAERAELASLQAELARRGVDMAAVAHDAELAIGEAIAGMHREERSTMPADVRDRLADVGERLVNNAMFEEPYSGPISIEEERAMSQSKSAGGMLGWAVAAAAIAVAGFVWMRTQPPPSPAPNPGGTPVAQTAPDGKKLAQLRADLLKDAATHTLTWAKGAIETTVEGDVVWNNVKQEGYLRFSRAARNDASKEQYQLWIYDKARADWEKLPIDGGVFDLGEASVDPATGDMLVKITPKLRVLEPAKFALSLEKPGGVVVTNGERLIGWAIPAKG